MDRTPAFAFLLLLAGCMQPGPTPSEPAEEGPTTCPWRPAPLVAQVMVVGHHIRTPDGYSEGGRYHEFPWSATNDTLVRLEVRLEWDANGPLTETLMVGLPREHGPDIYAYGPYNGPSPLEATIEMPDRDALRDPLHVNFGASRNQTAVGGWAEPEQPATLTVQETYDPCLRRG